MNSIDKLLIENFNIEPHRQHRVLKQLLEHEKVDLSKNLVDSIYKKVAQRAYDLDYSQLEESKGDITKIEGYNIVIESLALLKSIDTSLQNSVAMKEINIIEQAIENVKRNTTNFEAGFNTNSHQVIILYNNITLAIVASTSFVIATMVDFVKNVDGNYDLHFRLNNSHQHGHPSIYLDSLERFNNEVQSGKLAQFFEYALGKRALTGSAIGAGVVITILLSYALIQIIRECVYQYYHSRITMSDNLKLQAEFIKLNVEKKKGTKGVSKTTIQKQEKIAKALVKQADKIDVGLKVGEKKAKQEIKRESQSVSVSNPTISYDTNDYQNSLI